ncbi:MAG: hypothetical protein KKA10_17360 [Euryarchaeota archaeon]|nr:hypothetical protein [Euryarchaeota archaeon]MCG2738151.1 hypothetical protein [Candidatus Methanoperedenaceae archaeon]
MNETNDVADATQPTREEMIAFLRGHFRYYTMNSGLSLSFTYSVALLYWET